MGLDVVRAARALVDPPGIVVFTGHHRLKAEAETAGCDAFVLKPELEELLARVSIAITARVGRTPPAAVGRKMHG
jgi:CheY-like chemotaxis protein